MDGNSSQRRGTSRRGLGWDRQHVRHSVGTEVNLMDERKVAGWKEKWECFRAETFFFSFIMTQRQRSDWMKQTTTAKGLPSRSCWKRRDDVGSVRKYPQSQQKVPGEGVSCDTWWVGYLFFGWFELGKKRTLGCTQYYSNSISSLTVMAMISATLGLPNPHREPCAFI